MRGPALVSSCGRFQYVFGDNATVLAFFAEAGTALLREGRAFITDYALTGAIENANGSSLLSAVGRPQREERAKPPGWDGATKRAHAQSRRMTVSGRKSLSECLAHAAKCNGLASASWRGLSLEITRQVGSRQGAGQHAGVLGLRTTDNLREWPRQGGRDVQTGPLRSESFSLLKKILQRDVGMCAEGQSQIVR